MACALETPLFLSQRGGGKDGKASTTGLVIHASFDFYKVSFCPFFSFDIYIERENKGKRRDLIVASIKSGQGGRGPLYFFFPPPFFLLDLFLHQASILDTRVQFRNPDTLSLAA